MFRFGKNSDKQAADVDLGEDLLAQREQEEFEESVRAARERAVHRNDKADALPPPEENCDAEITWSEQEDIFRPSGISLHEFVAMLGAALPRAFRQGCSLVAIRPEALDTLSAHVASDTTVELGGLLAGQVFHDSVRGAYMVLVEAALPALHGEGTPTSFTYTPASWGSMLPDLNRMQSGWTLVGSYHSHPGLGIFLSATDLATQHDVFPHDWQIAIVIDPISRSIGYFMGVDGAPCPHILLPETKKWPSETC